jgi:signal transduction histidine kinase
MATDAPTDAGRLAELHKMASLGRMLAAVVHEFNTPLGSLTSNADVTLRAIEAVKKLLAGGPEPAGPPLAKVMALLETIAGLAAVDKIACQRIAGLVRGLRTFSREDQGEFRKVQVHDLIEDALKLVGWIYGQRIAVERDFGALPEIECFPQALSHVFLNLLANAGQAIEGEGTVAIRTRAEEGFVHVAISDSGRGIRAEDQPKVFSRGFTTKPAGEGTGLGLSIARDIVVGAHGGTLDFESPPGAGATFHVRLPVSQPEKHAH